MLVDETEESTLWRPLEMLIPAAVSDFLEQ